MSKPAQFTFATDLAQHRILLILEALDTSNGLTADDLAGMVGLVRDTVCKYLDHMRSLGLVYVCAWPRKRDCGPRNRAFKVAHEPMRDAPKPRKLTRQESERRYHRKLMNDPERYMNRMRFRRAREGAMPKVDPLVAALFGARGNDVSHG